MFQLQVILTALDALVLQSKPLINGLQVQINNDSWPFLISAH